MNTTAKPTVGTTPAALADYVATALPPLAPVIDRQGLYPASVLAAIGTRGGFGAAEDGRTVSLLQQIESIATVARRCGSTGFATWCQSASAWYLAHAPNKAVRERHLAAVASGRLLAGSGMSNVLKHLAGIEKLRLTAHAESDGFRVDGILPWVSNLASGHLLLTAAAHDDGYVMLAIPIDRDGVSLHACPPFSGMEGTSTWNVRLNGVHVAADEVLARRDEFDAFIAAVKPGLILSQVGLGLGVIAASRDSLSQSDAVPSATNSYLDDDSNAVRATLEALHTEAVRLATWDNGPTPLLSVLRLRARASEWALRAAQSAALHAGARGYLLRHPAQRLLREATFVAIVTPALKHLRKEIADLERNAHAEAA